MRADWRRRDSATGNCHLVSENRMKAVTAENVMNWLVHDVTSDISLAAMGEISVVCSPLPAKRHC